MTANHLLTSGGDAPAAERVELPALQLGNARAECALAAAPTPRAAPEGRPLWAVHVRGPDDIVAVASYDDAVRVADGLTLLYASLTLTEDDPWMSAVPCLWTGRAEDHATAAAKLGTRGYDYGVPTDAAIEALRDKVMASRIAAPPAPARGAVDLAGVEAAVYNYGLYCMTYDRTSRAETGDSGPAYRQMSEGYNAVLDAVCALGQPAGEMPDLIRAACDAAFELGDHRVAGEPDEDDDHRNLTKTAERTELALSATIAALQRDAAMARTSGTGSGVRLNWHAPTDNDELKMAVFGHGGLITWVEGAWHSLMLAEGETRIRPLQRTPTEVADVPGMAEARDRATPKREMGA